MTRFAQFSFFAAALITFIMAVLPHPPHVPFASSDKVQHMAAFATLAVLGTIAFPSIRISYLIVGLIAFGALIEVVQMIPVLHRDSDILDLAADTLAVVMAATLVRLVIKAIRR